MEKKDEIWIEELGLDKSAFANVPEGESTLTWAYKNDLLKEEAYVHWASAHYQTPAIRPEFFSMGLDLTLIEKFSTIHDWSETCFPVYQWEETLYVACQHPIDLGEQNVCYIIAPYSPMTAAWRKFRGQPVSNVIDPQAIQPAEESIVFHELETLTGVQVEAQPPVEIPPEAQAKRPVEVHPPAEASPEAQVETPVVSQSPVEAPPEDQGATPVAAQPEVVASTEVQAEQNQKQQTESDSAVFDLDFSSLGNFDAQEAVATEPPPIPVTEAEESSSALEEDEPAIPTPPNDELLDFTAEMATLERPIDTNPLREAASLIDKAESSESLEDEASGKVPTVESPMQLDETISDVPLASLSQAGPVPSAYAITDQDLSANSQLGASVGLKATISHIFHHLRKDYNQLMWLECGADGQYRPRFMYGTWAATETSLRQPVNLEQPNIFKIAHSTRLPFHGRISDSPFNEKYFDLWLLNQKPNVATIFPIKVKKHITGFLLGFNKGKAFDEVDSLRKIENLVSLSKDQLVASTVKKAS